MEGNFRGSSEFTSRSRSRTPDNYHSVRVFRTIGNVRVCDGSIRSTALGVQTFLSYIYIMRLAW